MIYSEDSNLTYYYREKHFEVSSIHRPPAANIHKYTDDYHLAQVLLNFNIYTNCKLILNHQQLFLYHCHRHWDNIESSIIIAIVIE